MSNNNNKNRQKKQVNFEKIPDELKIYRNWCCWRTELRDGKPTKIPIDAKTGKNAECNNPDTWSSFEQSVSYYEQNLKPHFPFSEAGIGFFFSDSDPYTGIDLDDCVQNLKLNSQASAKIEKLNSYTEFSPSLDGTHTIVRAVKPGDKCRTGKLDWCSHVEMYDKLRYFTFTGHVMQGYEAIKSRQKELTVFYNEVFGQNKQEKKRKDKTTFTDKNFDDQTLLDLAFRAKNGEKFKNLWTGNWEAEGYPSQSEADLAFCEMLAFWTGGDRERCDRLFRQSGLFREKWERKDYRDRTIDKAFSNQTEYYNPKEYHKSERKKAQEEFDLKEALEDIPEVGDRFEFAEKIEGLLEQALKAGTPKDKLRMWIDSKLKSRLKTEFDEKDTRNYQSMLSRLYENYTEQTTTEQEEQRYFREHTFIPKRLADELMSEDRYIFSASRLYVYRDGVYRPKGSILAKRKCREKLTEDARTHRIDEVIAHISDLNYIETNKLNTHGNLINLKNGMYNWIEDKMIDHDPKYLSTMRIPVTYDPEAKCPKIDNFFETTIPKDCIPIVKELFGYSLIPDTRFEKAFMLLGSGANGKSTFLKLLEAFVGASNVSKVPLQEITDNRFKRAELHGKLINLFADLSSRAINSSSYFKAIVSGDSMNVERKHRDPFEFEPFCRLVFSANELPQSQDKTFAYYRRWIIIPFPNIFSGDKADKALLHKITRPQELSGLFNIALKGLRRLFRQREFTSSKTVKDELNDYKKQNDTVSAFILEACEFDTDAEVERGELYEQYCKYCNREGLRKKESRRSMYDKVRSYQETNEKRLASNERVFTGIKVKD